jgi:hypothetical protein
MLGRLLEALVFLLLLRAAWTVLTTLLAASRGTTRAAARGAPPAVKLLRDPVCGTYVSPATAISDGHRYFCSEKCRNEYKLRA